MWIAVEKVLLTTILKKIFLHFSMSASIKMHKLHLARTRACRLFQSEQCLLHSTL